jgi:AAA ATPase domain
MLKRIHNAFDPFEPLPAGDPVYVDCREVRGDGDILRELGREIEFSDRIACQLYSGHRGAGKSTELLRLQKYLDDQKYFVVYFAADQEDIDSEDAQYTDILLACTRHLLEALAKNANPAPLLKWLKDRWQDLKDLALTEVSLEKFEIEAGIADFAKITANLKTEPTQRRKIRDRFNPHTITLLAALNQFIDEAKKNLPEGYLDLVVIADNLDRIVPVIQEDGRSNHDHIFLDRNEQLKALHCHLIYTVPISMLYSHRATNLRDAFGSDAQVLPMIMVRTPDNEIYAPGLDKVKEVIQKRIRNIDPELNLVGGVFDGEETLNNLCLMSGGHVRELLLLVRDAVKRSDSLPITAKAVLRSLSLARDVYRKAVDDNQWSVLARVSQSKTINNNDLERGLLFNRCLLEYRYWEGEEVKRWYDVHPLIKGIEEFQQALAKLSNL